MLREKSNNVTRVLYVEMCGTDYATLYHVEAVLFLCGHILFLGLEFIIISLELDVFCRVGDLIIISLEMAVFCRVGDKSGEMVRFFLLGIHGMSMFFFTGDCDITMFSSKKNILVFEVSDTDGCTVVAGFVGDIKLGFGGV